MKDYFDTSKMVSVEWLKDHMEDPDVRIVEVGTLREEMYPGSHIPGAIYWPWKETLWDKDTREFVLPPDFAKLLGDSGVTPDTTIVFYSEMCQFANYALWTCLLRGHEKVKILNGSRKIWVTRGLPMTDVVPTVKKVAYPVQPSNEGIRISRTAVLAGLNNPDRVILDVRTLKEYNGERVKPEPGPDFGAERAGRIPGAKHLLYEELLNDDDTFKDAEELKRVFEKRGATADKDIVSYCRLSHRASMVWFVARYLLGYPRARSYDGSWTEWGSIVGYPVERDD
jgi:thiosulfate/3-mercaptopyruvate sulfurtransferase